MKIQSQQFIYQTTNYMVRLAKSCQRPLVARDIRDDFQSLKTVRAMHESALVLN